MIFDPTQLNWVFVVVSLVVVFLTLSTVYLFAYLNYEPWQVRKLGHMILHSVLAFFPYFIDNLFDLIITMSITMVLLLIFSLIPQIRFVPKIIEKCTREGDKNMQMVINSTLTGIAVLLVYVLFLDKPYVFTAAFLSVSLGDGLGEMIGRPYGKIKYRIFEERSLEGTIAVFVGTAISIFVALAVNKMLTVDIWWKILVIALIGTIVEACNYRFLDNVTLPAAIALMTYLLIELPL
ncbi:MAG: diacylglycerol/polyprenol kinase family protein [Candidatus Heimdallarchaeaceae archaeon]